MEKKKDNKLETRKEKFKMCEKLATLEIGKKKKIYVYKS